jgi:cbb3-type cytochrome oxidase subunit 3
MYHEFFSKSPLLVLPILSLFLFVTIFALACLRAFGARGKELAKVASRLPLDDDEFPKEARYERREP